MRRVKMLSAVSREPLRVVLLLIAVEGLAHGEERKWSALRSRR
jgi:hypothetical protein